MKLHIYFFLSKYKRYFTSISHRIKTNSDFTVSFTDDDTPIGFAGIADDKLEMLFLSPDYFQQGIGYKMISTAIQDYQIKYVDVNKQNPKALKFYYDKVLLFLNIHL